MKLFGYFYNKSRSIISKNVPLMYDCWIPGNESVVRLLLENKANVNAESDTNRTPLFEAAVYGKALRSHSSNINKTFCLIYCKLWNRFLFKCLYVRLTWNSKNFFQLNPWESMVHLKFLSVNVEHKKRSDKSEESSFQWVNSCEVCMFHFNRSKSLCAKTNWNKQRNKQYDAIYQAVTTEVTW